MNLELLPRGKGSYLLVLRLPEPKTIQVGRLGRIAFERGWYAYAGSAFGPGGLAARLRHHLVPVRRPHWHIDYFRVEARVTEIWTAEGMPCREHDWASALTKGIGAGTVIRGFGCSDCRCLSHLIYFKHGFKHGFNCGFNRRPAKAWLMKVLGEGTVKCCIRK